MIKRPVCRKLPRDLSIFLNQPQMVHSFGCNTSELCYEASLRTDVFNLSHPPGLSINKPFISLFWGFHLRN